jgi:hypothetical protein
LPVVNAAACGEAARIASPALPAVLIGTFLGAFIYVSVAFDLGGFKETVLPEVLVVVFILYFRR